MAMTSCRECGQQVAELARTCPRCGLGSPGHLGYLRASRSRRRVEVALVLVACVLLAVGAYLFGEWRIKQDF